MRANGQRELKRKLDHDEEFEPVMVRGERMYRARHIPGWSEHDTRARGHEERR